MKFVNRSNFNSIIIQLNTEEESEKYQSLLFRYGFIWNGDTGKFINTSRGNIVSYIYADFKNMMLVYSVHVIDYHHIEHNKLFYNKIYDINNYDELSDFLRFGNIKPTYNPKKIIK